MYEQKVIWLGTVMGDSTSEEFENFFLETFGYHVKFDEEFELIGELKGIHCLIFGVCDKELSKFALFRIRTSDMKWWEDFKDNYGIENIPDEILKKYN